VTLHAADNGLTDLGSLSGLSLGQLFIDDNAISDLSPIGGLTHKRW
jgi:Leucine-rich repeat (LRR) protein